MDHLNSQFSSAEIKVIYIFFDYKSQQSQGVINIVENLLKQLLSTFDNIPPRVEELYDQWTLTNCRPDQGTLLQLLAMCSQNFSHIYGLFDAVDESSETYHADLVDLFSHLENLGYKLLITGRPGSPLSKLRNTLRNSHTLEIRANQSDIQSYVTSRVAQGVIRTKSLKLMEKANGM